MYFYFPDDWKSKYNDYYDASVGLESCLPAIYWWGNSSFLISDYPPYEKSTDWPGFILTDEVAPNIYKAEIPVDVEYVIFNNGVDGGMDKAAPVYAEAKQSEEQTIGYDDCDSYGFYPDGISKDNFDNMIFVIDENADRYWNRPIYVGSWFYYYGNGEYGPAQTKEEARNYFFSNGEFPSEYPSDVLRTWNYNSGDDTIKIGVGEEESVFTTKCNVTAVSDNNEIVTVVPEDEDESVFTLTGVSLGETQVTFTYVSELLDRIETATVKVIVTEPQPKLIIHLLTLTLQK